MNRLNFSAYTLMDKEIKEMIEQYKNKDDEFYDEKLEEVLAGDYDQQDDVLAIILGSSVFHATENKTILKSIRLFRRYKWEITFMGKR